MFMHSKSLFFCNVVFYFTVILSFFIVLYLIFCAEDSLRYERKPEHFGVGLMGVKTENDLNEHLWRYAKFDKAVYEVGVDVTCNIVR